jgi:hypothetical protein
MKALAIVLLLASCSTKSKTEITDKAMADPSRRAQIMEATLRVLDQHPEYTDEFFQQTRRHDKTMNRFLADTARAQAKPEFARQVAAHLVEQPAGLREVMIQTLDAARDKPAAQRAITDAVAQRPDEVAQYLKNSPDTLHKLKDLAKALL